jgi:hypothetical protein
MAFDLASAVERAKSSGALHISNLGLTSVPRAIFDALPLLRRLDLSHNELTSLPAEIGKLRNLEQLWLNDNPLSSLPSELETLVALRVLDVRDTPLTTLPSALGKLPLIEVGLSRTRLDAELQGAYAAGGTLKLLSVLNAREERRELESTLRDALAVDVYAESADTELGRARVEEVVADVADEFADNDEFRTVVRNAGRLFHSPLPDVSAREVRERYTELVRDNLRKALAADVELKIRALYYDRVDVRKVGGLVEDIMRHLPSLEDAAFLLTHAGKLFPPEARDISGERMYSELLALRASLAAERAGALSALVRALTDIYPDREPAHVESLALAVSGSLKTPEDILMLASDAAEIFPAEFGSARPKKIVAAFKVAKKEKGL